MRATALKARVEDGILTSILELLIMRKGMWIAVETRLHTVHKIFPFGAGADEVMIYGIVDYKFKDGRNTTVRHPQHGECSRLC